ncbi:Set1 complex component [Wickerhamomyces ciferrii]|uniref:Set1 complex component n=1 Tax=Wickerhamomyces ciferrii (strain ATCC 14091 / BCRC 22168 / CBS 111 / JCM 3599 / NBRC 0793 / NRRL Y-1031 F-60-10) TaxID=1206466 RepID=K0KFE1_WICCF|nr:Set1 complex component [Wickerhamomyces ciferrii]CCH43835.1 Set1 complex component [Wickerhamomyces ciferrii]
MAIDSDSDTERDLSAESTVEEEEEEDNHKHNHKRRKFTTASYTNMSNDNNEQNEKFNGQYIKDTKYPNLPIKSTKLYNENSEEVFCICRKPDHGELMVGCDGCDDWYHFKCMKINLKFRELIANYYCPYCEIEGKGVTHWKRKCRVSKCFKPILENSSKYCSKEHGLEYLSNIINVQLNQEGVGINRDQVGEMVKISDNIEDFKKIGEKLPDLPDMNLIIKDSRILNLDDSIEILKKEKEINLNKKKILLKNRENIKKLNEILTTDLNVEPSSTTNKKKPKIKKIDLCGYDLIFNTDKFENNNFQESELISNDLTLLKTQYNQLINSDESTTSTPTTFCFLDRKKCLKHNGWISVINDEIELNLKKIDKKINSNFEKGEKIIKTIKTDFFEKK